MIRQAVVLAVVLGSVAVSAQSRAPTFDVVSIRHDASSRFCLNNRSERPQGAYSLMQGSIAVLIGEAYAILSRDIVGLPEWATSECYDIVTTANVPNATAEDRRTMKQALLAERFKFRAHVEMRESQGFDLVKAHTDGRLGPGLVPYDVDCIAVALAAQEARAAGQPPPPESVGTECSAAVSRGGLGGAMPMSILADLLASVLKRPVVDKTGVDGTFRIKLSFDQPATARADAPPSDTLPSLFAALPEQLGLKLEPSRTQVRVLVVDSIEQPTPN